MINKILVGGLAIGIFAYANKMLSIKNGIDYQFGKIKPKMPFVRKEGSKDAYYLPVLVTMLLKNSSNDAISIENIDGSIQFNGAETAKMSLNNPFTLESKGSTDIELTFDVKINVDLQKSGVLNLLSLWTLVKEVLMSGKPMILQGSTHTSLGHFPFRKEFYAKDFV